MKIKEKRMMLAWCVAAGIGLGATTSYSVAEQNPAITEYDKNYATPKDRRDGMRSWERVELEDGPTSIGVMGKSANNDIQAGSLESMWGRINQYSEFTDLRDRVDENRRDIDENTTNISGLDDRVGSLEGRVDKVEDAAWAADPGRTATGSWVARPGSEKPLEEWGPAISNQTRDFNQTRDALVTEERTIQEYEINEITGQKRPARKRTETRMVTHEFSRTIDVANNPNGGADGWSGWVNSGKPNNCSGWSPSPATVIKGKRFKQTKKCSQPQESSIYYLHERNVLASAKRNRSVANAHITQRNAKGTKATEICEFDRHNFIAINRGGFVGGGYSPDKFLLRRNNNDYERWNEGGYVGGFHRLNNFPSTTHRIPYEDRKPGAPSGLRASQFGSSEFYPVCKLIK